MIKLDSVSPQQEQGLKPCPFCGGKAMIDHSLVLNNSWKVFCVNCGCGTGIYDGNTPHSAIRSWNRRFDNEKEVP